MCNKRNAHDVCGECVGKPVPHKHAALIKAWADGAEIQEYDKNRDSWVNIGFGGCCIVWSLKSDYRIKPIPKPDRVRVSRIALYDSGSGKQTQLINLFDRGIGGLVEYTFDGETGVLKSVCLPH
jgi:hypothetical protein